MEFCLSDERPLHCCSHDPALLCKQRQQQDVQPDENDEDRGTVVILHIYDIAQTSFALWANTVLHKLGLGVYHVAVELHGSEYSFSGDGVYCGDPGRSKKYRYRGWVYMGDIGLTFKDVNEIINDLQNEWRPKQYDPLRRNCIHFCDVVCCRIGVGHLPKWIMRFTGPGTSKITM
jgi:hypothetical protein